MIGIMHSICTGAPKNIKSECMTLKKIKRKNVCERNFDGRFSEELS